MLTLHYKLYLHYTRSITLKRVTSGGAHRSGGELLATLTDSTGPGFEPLTSCSGSLCLKDGTVMLRDKEFIQAVLAETSLTNSQMTDELKNLNEAIRDDAARYRKRIKELVEDNKTIVDRFTTLKRAAELLQKEKDVLEEERREWCERVELMVEQKKQVEDEKIALEVGSDD